MIARNLKEGEEIWKAKGTKAQGVGLTANKNHILAVDEKGAVRAFNLKGEELWKKELPEGSSFLELISPAGGEKNIKKNEK